MSEDRRALDARIKLGRAILQAGRYADAERATLAGYRIVEAGARAAAQATARK